MTVRRIRQSILFILLLSVALWGLAQWRADHFVFAWDRPVNVLVVAVSDPRADPLEDVLRGFLSRFLSTGLAFETNLSGIEKWFQAEYARQTLRSSQPIKCTARGPVRAERAPPLPPPADAPFLERWKGTREFLGYFEEMGKREHLVLEGYDAVIFVYFYSDEEEARYAGQHSVASRRSRMGVVFSPVGPRHFARCATLLAHELCHTLGATDKYDGDQSVFPDGFAEPEKSPRYPQSRAEIMALGIPVSASHEVRVGSLLECVVGRKTAEEMGWER